MAELTNLETKLAEAMGLAMAAASATTGISKLLDNTELVEALERMNHEAGETEERCATIAGALDGKKTAILEEARATNAKAAEMMSTYLDDDADGLDGFEFLTMAEAGEVGHWAVLSELCERAGNEEVRELVAWALPIQERHFQQARDGSLRLAAEEDPNEVSG
jgi:hypothetical protein